MKKQIFVKDITEQLSSINDVFVVTKKDMFAKKDNTKYISLLLSDRTGSIEGRIWERVEELNGYFEKYDIVSVQASLQRYQDRLQLNIKDIRTLDEELTLEHMKAFYPESKRGTEELKQEFFDCVREIRNPYIRSLFNALHNQQEIQERLFLFPASIGIHHTYISGLLEHSLTMARIGKVVVDISGGDRDIVIAGCLLHDIGKIDEITIRGGFKYSDKGRLIGHIGLGIIRLEACIRTINDFPPYISDVLTHIIISHHGMEEWGSPRKPMCVEALIVHYIDNLDAKVSGVKEHMEKNMEDERWTDYHRLYESRFYKIPEG